MSIFVGTPPFFYSMVLPSIFKFLSIYMNMQMRSFSYRTLDKKICLSFTEPRAAGVPWNRLVLGANSISYFPFVILNGFCIPILVLSFKTYGWLFESRTDPLTHLRTISEPVRTLFAEGTERMHNRLGVC